MEITVGDISRDQEIAFLRKADILSVKEINEKDGVLSLFEQYNKWVKENDLDTIGLQCFLQKLLVVGAISVEMLNFVFKTEFLHMESDQENLT